MSASPVRQFVPRFAARQPATGPVRRSQRSNTTAQESAAPYPANSPNQAPAVTKGPDQVADNVSIHPNLAAAAAQVAGASLGLNSDIDPLFSAEEQDNHDTPLTELGPGPTSGPKDKDIQIIQQLGEFLRLPDIQIENIQQTATKCGPFAPEDEDIQIIQQLGEFLRLPDIQIENIQQTATFVQQNHWLATLMYLEWIRYQLEQTGSIQPKEVGPAPQVTRHFVFHPNVQDFICLKI
ncbi:hypothetical protein PTTG_27237 [Puccinia triticina 1-1 BBBD Race 1]|uniref:Uncharacterized protein n=1 Tax=Puccinia triticina (isolate 1-1 / race 1 (BBBD)) TaxID=630390 RepID=A0A180GLL0_PUCT1|nr:hypothetical protein PTTG_27237 [Puccinia triticina 1-1 BBBD Race 1]WAR56460.1 hypothetical protein PtB15_7B309 [Puccinia triticina]